MNWLRVPRVLFLTVCGLCLFLTPPPGFAVDFIRGDADCDGCVSIVDPYVIGAILFLGMAPPCDCDEARDTNCDGALDLDDVVYLLDFVALGGPAPCAPFPGCGPEATAPTCVAYPTCPLFKRGDADSDGCVSAADASFILDYLAVAGAPAPDCFLAADANDDDMITVADSVLILGYCSAGGPPPPAPGPLVCGEDPTPGVLGCVMYTMAACCAGCSNQIQCDCNQDGMLDISDVICILGFLFLGTPAALPCGDLTGAHPSNIQLLSCNGDLAIDVSDPVYLLTFLFLGGPGPTLGPGCVYIEDCPQHPDCPICMP